MAYASFLTYIKNNTFNNQKFPISNVVKVAKYLNKNINQILRQVWNHSLQSPSVLLEELVGLVNQPKYRYIDVRGTSRSSEPV